VAARVQLRTPAQLAGIQDATGVRGIPGLYSLEKQSRETPVIAG
jgi:hypothetical protein